MRVLNSIKAGILLLTNTKIFTPKNFLDGKRVAVIGAADSAFDEEMGNYINDFDFIIRVNKAPHSWSPDKAKYIGNRTDILFHSFYENSDSGGGIIDFDLYKKQGIKYLINPNSSLQGIKTHLIFYKRNLEKNLTYLLNPKIYLNLQKEMKDWVPTVGYSALYCVLNSSCKEAYITGFTFFKTPYADDYRDHLKDMDKNKTHIEKQALHNPDLEFELFQMNLEKTNCLSVKMDNRLSQIIKMQSS